jgi:hypothetical protein
MVFLLFGGIGLVIVIILTLVRIAISSAKARRILRQAEEAEKQGDLQNAAKHYKDLILAVAANEKEVPVWLARLEAVYEKQGRQMKTDEIMNAHKTIVDIWKSKMSNSEKRRLHRVAIEGMKSKLEALP